MLSFSGLDSSLWVCPTIRNATSKMKEFSVNLIKFIGPMILGAAGIKRTGGLFPYNVSDGSQYKPPM